MITIYNIHAVIHTFFNTIQVVTKKVIILNNISILTVISNTKDDYLEIEPNDRNQID